MNTTHPTPRSRHGRIAAATMLLAAPAIIAGTLVVAAPANAAVNWVGLAAADDGSNIGGVGYGPTSQAANIAALDQCIAKGGSHCAYYGNTENQCIALAVPYGQWGGGGGWATGTGPEFGAAQAAALAKVPGGQILAVGCSRRQAPTVPGRPAPPTVPGRPPIQQP
jgi:hypothetical protein